MIRCAVTALRGHAAADWLVLGKGPTAVRVAELPPQHYRLLTLNDAVRLAPTPLLTFAHFTDYEAWRRQAGYVAERDFTAVLPWLPHQRMKPGPDTLLALCRRDRDLQWLLAQNRLLCYNSTLAGPKKRRPGLGLVRVRLFSAVAAFNLLGAAGVRKVHSLGVDGGTEYAPCFDPAHRLANGRASFGPQLPELKFALKRYGMTWEPL